MARGILPGAAGPAIGGSHPEDAARSPHRSRESDPIPWQWVQLLQDLHESYVTMIHHEDDLLYSRTSTLVVVNTAMLAVLAALIEYQADLLHDTLDFLGVAAVVLGISLALFWYLSPVISRTHMAHGVYRQAAYAIEAEIDRLIGRIAVAEPTWASGIDFRHRIGQYLNRTFEEKVRDPADHEDGITSTPSLLQPLSLYKWMFYDNAEKVRLGMRSPNLERWRGFQVIFPILWGALFAGLLGYYFREIWLHGLALGWVLLISVCCELVIAWAVIKWGSPALTALRTAGRKAFGVGTP
jgi:hypothetical protein